MSCFSGVILATILFTHLSTPIYEATTTVVFEEAREPIPAFDFSQAVYNKSFIQNQIEEIKSRTLAEEVANLLPEKIIKPHNPVNSLPAGLTRHELIAGRIRENISAEPVRNSDIIKIKVRSNDPSSAAIIANTVTKVLKERHLKVKREEVSSMREFIEDQLKVFEDQLKSTELSLKEFKEENLVTSLDEEAREILRRVTEAEVLYNAAQSNYAATEHRFAYVHTKLAKQRKQLAVSITEVVSPWAQKLKEKLVDLEVQYTTLKVQDYREDDPQVVKLKDQIAQTRQKLAAEMLKILKGESLIDPLSEVQDLLQQKISLEIELETYKAHRNALSKIVNTYKRRLQSLPEKEYQLASLTREKDVSDRIYTMLLEKHEEARITEAGKVSSIRVMDPARTPVHPVKPRKKLNLAVGMIVGLMLGVGVSLLAEYTDSSLKTIEDIESFTNLSVLGSIPMIKKKGKSENPASEIASHLVTRLPGKSHITEAYRSIRTSIQFTSPDKPISSILLTSALPKEGKTLTASNLGIVIALSGVKTLLVDSDLRKPMLHTLFNKDREPGLVNVLAGQCEVESVIKETEVSNLYLMPCGTIPPNPAEILGSHKMKDLLNALKGTFDIILLDSPPVIAVTDPVVLASEVDGTIIVVRSGRTNRDAVGRAKGLLEGVNARIIGAILNNIRVEGLYGKKYGYYSHYYYYYTDKGEKTKRRRA